MRSLESIAAKQAPFVSGRTRRWVRRRVWAAGLSSLAELPICAALRSWPPHREHAEAVWLDRRASAWLTCRSQPRRGEMQPLQFRIQRCGTSTDPGGNGGADAAVICVVLMHRSDRAVFAVYSFGTLLPVMAGPAN